MYTIREASARSGVGTPLIRAWERRYGVVSPVRTPAGYRLYDDAALRVLATMRSLIDSGWTASEAARAITGGEVSVEEAAPGPAAESGDTPTAVAANRARMIGQFVSAAETASAAGTEAALDDILASASFEAVVDDLLLPAAAALGDSWSAGRMSVAAEHAASGAVARRLAAAYQGAGIQARTPVVVGLPPGSRHELGALAFAAALRRQGTGVLYLGADVPVDGWVDAVTRNRARAAVIGVVTEGDRPAAAAVIAALGRANVPVVAVGGSAAGGGREWAGDALRLPERVVDAAVVVAKAVRGRR